MKSSELMTSSFDTFLLRVEAIAIRSLEANVDPGITPSPKGQGSLFQKAHEVIVEMSKERLPKTITRLMSGLDAITENFFDGKSGMYAALEAARAQDHLKEATILSCCVDSNIRRALQIGLWAAELATKAKTRHAENAYSIGVTMQESAEKGANATRKMKPTAEEFAEVISRARQDGCKEVAVDKKASEIYRVGLSKIREWKAEFNLLKRPKKYN